MTTLRGLASRLREQAAKVEDDGNRLAITAARAIVKDLASVTPVDTTQALSNWRANDGAPVPGAPIAPHSPGKGGVSQPASAAATIAAAERVFAGKRPGVPLYLSNVVPYIRRLNDGSSKQAPAGFVERAVLIGRSIVRRRGRNG